MYAYSQYVTGGITGGITGTVSRDQDSNQGQVTVRVRVAFRVKTYGICIRTCVMSDGGCRYEGNGNGPRGISCTYVRVLQIMGVADTRVTGQGQIRTYVRALQVTGVADTRVPVMIQGVRLYDQYIRTCVTRVRARCVVRYSSVRIQRTLRQCTYVRACIEYVRGVQYGTVAYVCVAQYGTSCTYVRVCIEYVRCIVRYSAVAYVRIAQCSTVRVIVITDIWGHGYWVTG